MSGTLRDKLEAIASARFDAVELFEPDFLGFHGTDREVQRLAGDLGIAIDLYHSFQDFEGAPDAIFPRALERAECKFDVVEKLGASMVAVTSNASAWALADPDLAAEQLRVLAERAMQRNLRIAFEAVPSGRWVRTYQQAWSIVERAAHPHLGLLVDGFNTFSQSGDLSSLRDLPGDRIFFVRVADAQRGSTDEAVALWYRTLPAQGELAVVGFLEQVLFTGYSGTISLARGNDVLRATPNRRTGIDAMRAALFLESQVRSRLERAASEESSRLAAEVLDTVDLFDPPKAPQLRGFAFLEFRVEEVAVKRSRAFLEQLGFVRYGRHRTKAVELYKQGGIRLVLNADPRTQARGGSSRPVSVSCLGLAADQPARAANRGTALLSARHDSPRGLQELELPTIVAPGGTLVQFVSSGRSVEGDFVEESGADGVQTGGLTAIDHVAMGLMLDQLDTWMLFGRAILGLMANEVLDVVEPFGFMRSRGLANDDRTVRIVLNASVTASAREGRSVRWPIGDVEYVALTCDDIFSTVERLAANGVSFVRISDNYYDDLEARGVLDDAVVRRMRQFGVMFDRSDAGTYLHASTEAFEGCLHVQIVQRTGYDGYGVVNTPVRAAAVEQLRQTKGWLETYL
jgi:4-hydroxyphenylpyruvate dioxygenase